MFSELNPIIRLLIRSFVIVGLIIIFIDSINTVTPFMVLLVVIVSVLISDGLWD